MVDRVQPDVRDAILEDPRVQEAVRKSGEDALRDPAVQAQIVEACKEKFPQVAAAIRNQALEWANDLEVQQKAYEIAGVARDYACDSVDYVSNLIEQGPAGIRVLAFFGGLGALVKSVSFLFGMFSLYAVANLPKYIVFAYQAVFAATTMLFEAKPEWIEMVPGLSGYQDMLIAKARFLSENAGRGLFYGFQGTLWICFASLTDLAELVLGLYFFFVSSIHLAMYFDYMPHEVAAKMRNVQKLVFVGNSASNSGLEEPSKSASVPSKPSYEEPGVQRELQEFSRPSDKEGSAPPQVSEEVGPNRDIEVHPAVVEDVSQQLPSDQEPLLREEDKLSRPELDTSPPTETPQIIPAKKNGGCCSLQ